MSATNCSGGKPASVSSARHLGTSSSTGVWRLLFLSLTGRHLAGLVGVEALLGHGLVDLGRPLGVDGQGLVGDAGDLPVPELARWSGIGLDAVTELDRFGGRGHPADHGGGMEVLPPEGGVGGLGAALGVQHLDHVGDEHVVVGAGVTGPGGGMAGVGVDQAGGRRRDGGHTSPSAPLFGQFVQVVERGVPFGVHDGVHVLRPTEDPQFGYRLVGGDDQLHARTPGVDQPFPSLRVTGSARSVEGVVGGVVDRADETERLRLPIHPRAAGSHLSRRSTRERHQGSRRRAR